MAATTVAASKSFVLRPSRVLLAVAGLTVLGALLRFTTLHTQSYWYDEAQTFYRARASFGGMLDAIHAEETTPPLYFALVWAWSRLFGVGEVALRSLSAVAGTATIPVAFGVTRILVGRRTGVIAALLVALSPPLIWYSQEARSYALLIFLCAVSLLFFVRAREQPVRQNFIGWALASALALTAHYFAVFLVVPEAVWLLTRGPGRRAAVFASAAVAATGLALAPLALYQRAHSGLDWLQFQPLNGRLNNVATVFVAGTDQVDLRASWILAGLLFVVIIVLLLRRADRRTRNGALVGLGLGSAVVVIPLLLALIGNDYVVARNLLPAWLPLCIVVAAAVGAKTSGPLGLIALFAACAVFADFDLRAQTTKSWQRDDWRRVAQELGTAKQDRVIVVAPGWQVRTLTLYLPRLGFMNSTRRVTEVDTVVYNGVIPAASRPQVPAPGPTFRLTARRTIQRMTVTRFRSPHPVQIAPTSLVRGAKRDRSLTIPFFQRAELAG